MPAGHHLTWTLCKLTHTHTHTPPSNKNKTQRQETGKPRSSPEEGKCLGFSTFFVALKPPMYTLNSDPFAQVPCSLYLRTRVKVNRDTHHLVRHLPALSTAYWTDACPHAMQILSTWGANTFPNTNLCLFSLIKLYLKYLDADPTKEHLLLNVGMCVCMYYIWNNSAVKASRPQTMQVRSDSRRFEVKGETDLEIHRLNAGKQ